MSDRKDIITFTAEIVAAHVANNRIAINDLPALVHSVHSALAGLGAPEPESDPKKKGAVSARASIKPDFLICLECGQKRKTLKSHLRTEHGKTPAEYRSEYGLPETYPMTAPNYSEHRRSLAKQSGLGTTGRRRKGG